MLIFLQVEKVRTFDFSFYFDGCFIKFEIFGQMLMTAHRLTSIFITDTVWRVSVQLVMC